MRTVLGLGLMFLLASAAAADEPPGPPPAKPLGIDLSLRLGPSIPGGANIVTSEPMFPLWLGLGYRIDGLWYVGVSGAYAFGSTICQGCTPSYNVQFLVEAAAHPLRYAKVDPWIGLGVGGDWFHDGYLNPSGWIPVTIELGVDFALARSFRAGPFYAFQLVVTGSSTHTWNVVGLQLTGLP